MRLEDKTTHTRKYFSSVASGWTEKTGKPQCKSGILFVLAGPGNVSAAVIVSLPTFQWECIDGPHEMLGVKYNQSKTPTSASTNDVRYVEIYLFRLYSA